jgi:hypothetical protein
MSKEYKQRLKIVYINVDEPEETFTEINEIEEEEDYLFSFEYPLFGPS